MKRLLHYLPSLLMAGLVFCLSVMQSPLPDSLVPQGFDKFAHLCMYAALAFVFSLDCRRDSLNTTLSFWLPWLAASLYGGLLELVQQRFFPPRTGEWADFAANVLGAFIGALIPLCLWHLHKKH